MESAMARAAHPLPISPKLFRQFAIGTLAITACLAMFADGESRQAIEQQIEKRQERNKLITTEANTLGARKLKVNGLKLREGNRSYMSFAQDAETAGESYGGSPVGTTNYEIGESAGVTAREAAPALGPAAMADAIKPELTPRPSPKKPAKRLPTAEQLKELTEKSAARSGQPG